MLNRFRYGKGLVRETPKRAPRILTATAPPPPPTVARMWETGPVLNQKRLGACAAFATTAELIAEPQSQVDVAVKVANLYGRNQYGRARVLSGWPAKETNDTAGSTMSSNMRVNVERGLATGWELLDTFEETLDAIANDGPVVLSLLWHTSFDQTPRTGLMKYNPRPRDNGWHAVLATGYDPALVLLTKRASLPAEPMVRIRNSWGAGWGEWPPVGQRSRVRILAGNGRTGDGWLRARDLRHMFDGGNAEAHRPVGRRPVDLGVVLGAHADVGRA